MRADRCLGNAGYLHLRFLGHHVILRERTLLLGFYPKNAIRGFANISQMMISTAANAGKLKSIWVAERRRYVRLRKK